VRAARGSDAVGIARVHIDSWRETYTGLMPERFFSEEAFDRRKQWWADTLRADHAPGPMFVAVRGDRVLGFASAGTSHQPQQEKGHEPARDLQLLTIYVLAAEHGTGIGQELLEAVLGDQPAQLWVAKENPRARAFYERNGFKTDGVEVDDGIVEIRMVR
jgi:ribosomal protein S18 acetylase RimI-like enzyme